MILRVDKQNFADEVKSRLAVNEVYVQPRGRRTEVTASKPGAGLVIASKFPESVTLATRTLEEAGFVVREGLWADSIEDLEHDERTPFVLAVAYKSENGAPGIWVDADHYERSHGEVLRRMFEEFVENGEVKETTFDEFVNAISANVVVLSPHEIESFAERNLG